MEVVEKKPEYDVGVLNSEDGLIDNVDGLHRRLSNRQIQFIAIGGNSNICSIKYHLLTQSTKAPLEPRCLSPSHGVFSKEDRLLSSLVS